MEAHSFALEEKKRHSPTSEKMSSARHRQPLTKCHVSILGELSGDEEGVTTPTVEGGGVNSTEISSTAYLRIDEIRGSHTFSIPASINGEVLCGSFLLGARVLRSSYFPLICHSCSQPPTLKNSTSGSFPDFFFHLAPDKIHPLALLILVVLFFYYIF